MGCVTCTPALEGVMPFNDQTVEDSLSNMIEPNTLSGEPLLIEPEPFINFVYDSLGQNADKTFLIDANEDTRYTFGDLLQRAKCWAQWLNNRGLGKGNVVSISSENNMDGFSIILGTWLSGAAANPINFNFTSSDIKTMFECSEPDMIYCSKNLEIVQQAVENLQKNTSIVTPGGKYPNIDSETIFKDDTSNFYPIGVQNSKDHVASIMFTSGTTGIPKGIQVLDHALKVYPKSQAFGMENIFSVFLGMGPVMITSPMFWVSNLAGFCFSLYNCADIIIPKKGWTAKDVLETIEKYKPKSWFTGHSLLLDLANKPFINDYDLSSLECVITGGTLLLANQKREINENVFKNKLFIKHIYGSTEVGIITKWKDDTDLETDEYNSVGTLERGVMLKVMDSSGRQLGPRQEGELWVKSQSMTPGYLTLKRKKIEASDENGWYHMGDLGFYDEKKLVYIVGRLKDIMKFRGVQIAPAEIEHVINDHPDVLESCVVGKFSVIDGDIPTAFVVLKDQATSSVNDLHDYLREKLAEVKRPHEIIILEEIPKSAVGKYLRNELEKLLI